MTVLPHKNKMVWAVLSTIFCCLLGGIFAIIHSSKSNSLYNSAILTTDDGLRQTLYLQSEEQNRKAGTWILVNIIIGLVGECGYIIMVAAGIFTGLAGISFI